jgi:hypothetical protein
LKASQENPNFQDFVTSLAEGPRAAIRVYKKFTEKQYQTMKRTMDALEPVLPPQITLSWKAIEAIHDEYISPD